MKSSDLIRWGGLAATIAGALFIIMNLTALLSSSFGQGSLGLLVRNVVSPVGGTLLVLGLTGLYARQSEGSGVVGLLGFLIALFGTVLALAGNAWANLLAYFGWALFGVASLQARPIPWELSPLGNRLTHVARIGHERCAKRRARKHNALVRVQSAP